MKTKLSEGLYVQSDGYCTILTLDSPAGEKGSKVRKTITMNEEEFTNLLEWHKNRKHHLGEGVYAEFGGCNKMMLNTQDLNGNVSNIIYISPQTAKAFNKLYKAWKREMKGGEK